MENNITNMFTDEEIENNKKDKKKNFLNQSEEFHEHNDDEEDYPQQKGIMDDPDEFKHFKEIVSTFFNYQV